MTQKKLDDILSESLSPSGSIPSKFSLRHLVLAASFAAATLSGDVPATAQGKAQVDQNKANTTLRCGTTDYPYKASYVEGSTTLDIYGTGGNLCIGAYQEGKLIVPPYTPQMLYRTDSGEQVVLVFPPDFASADATYPSVIWKPKQTGVRNADEWDVSTVGVTRKSHSTTKPAPKQPAQPDDTADDDHNEPDNKGKEPENKGKNPARANKNPPADVELLGEERAKRIFALLYQSDNPEDIKLADDLVKLYAGLPEDYLERIGCLKFPIISMGDKYVVLVQPTRGSGLRNIDNYSRYTTYAKADQCNFVDAITGRRGYSNPDLEGRLNTRGIDAHVEDLNSKVPGADLKATEVVRVTKFIDDSGMIKGVADYRVPDKKVRKRLNKAAGYKLVADDGHINWPASPIDTPEEDRDPYTRRKVDLRQDSPSLVDYEKKHPKANKVGNLLVWENPDQPNPTTVLEPVYNLAVPLGGQTVRLNTDDNTDKNPDGDDIIYSVMVTPKGVEEGKLTPDSLKQDTPSQIGMMAKGDKGWVAVAGKPLPSVAGGENPGIEVTLEPNKTYAVVLQDGPAYKVIPIVTTLQEIPATDLGKLVAKYGNKTVDVDSDDGCVPADTPFTLEREGMKGGLRSTVDVDGVEPSLDPAHPFDGPQEGPQRTLSEDSPATEYIGPEGDSATWTITKTHDIRVCPPEPVTPPTPQPPKTVTHRDTSLNMRRRIPGDSTDGQYVVGNLSYANDELVRPTSGDEAQIDVDTIHLDVTGRLPLDDEGKHRVSLFGRLGLDYMTGDVSVDGQHVQDINDDRKYVGGLGVDYRLVLPDLTLQTYVLGTGMFGSGNTDTDLPEGLSLLTERTHSGWGLEGRVVVGFPTFIVQVDGDYRSTDTEEQAAFGGETASEETSIDGRERSLDVALGTRNGRFRPLILGQWSDARYATSYGGDLISLVERDGFRLGFGGTWQMTDRYRLQGAVDFSLDANDAGLGACLAGPYWRVCAEYRTGSLLDQQDNEVQTPFSVKLGGSY